MTEPSDWAMKRALSLGILCGAVKEGNATYYGACGGGEPAYATACFSHRRIARALDASREEGARDAGWVEIAYKKGHRAGIEEAAKVAERYIGLNPVADEIRALSPEPEGEK